MKNLVLVPEMATARAAGLKDVTRRLRTNVKPGDVVYHGETLVPSTMSIPGNSCARVASSKDGTPCMVGRSVWLWEWNVSTLSSRFCPERCARLFSMIRSVREERLQDITEEDAKREGVQAREGTPGWSVFTEDGTAYWRAGDEPPVRGVDCVRDFVRSEPLFGATAMEVFCALWNELHPKAPWQANPHLSRIELGPNLTREDAERLAAIKDPAERLEVGKRWKRETESRQETEALAP